MGHKTPGLFETRIATLAKAAGGSFEAISTYSTLLSSRCLCGARKKKTLSERKHFCGCEHVPEGTFADRDEFSAFLAMFSQESVLGIERARRRGSSGGPTASSGRCLVKKSQMG